jgi:hypothetical protein
MFCLDRRHTLFNLRTQQIVEASNALGCSEPYGFDEFVYKSTTGGSFADPGSVRTSSNKPSNASNKTCLGHGMGSK